MSVQTNSNKSDIEKTTTTSEDRRNLIQRRETESAELNKLFEALSKAQLEMETAKTDSANPFFQSKYADLKSIVDASRPFLSKHGLCVVQRTLRDEMTGRFFLHTRLGHLSGQWMESVILVSPQKADIQSFGSSITYLRRYSYAALVGVVAGEEDDDGESGMVREEPKSDKISAAQLQVIVSELKGQENMVESILKGYKISKLSDLPASKYTQCIEQVRNYKMNMKKKEA